MKKNEMKTVTISRAHDGKHKMKVKLPWVCLICGDKRGEPKKEMFYDGSLRMEVDRWTNPCGHIERYSLVREQYIEGEKKKLIDEIIHKASLYLKEEDRVNLKVAHLPTLEKILDYLKEVQDGSTTMFNRL